MNTKALSLEDKASSIAISSQGEIDNVDTNIDLPLKKDVVGRLTGRTNSLRDQKLSKSLAETSINRFKDKDEQQAFSTQTPLTLESKAQDGLLPRPASPPA